MTEIIKNKRSFYLLPNAFTTIALFAAFYSIVAAMQGLFNRAAIVIYIAMIFDGLDGRIARLTNTQSDFGAQYDSLSDIIGFGLAPALIAYSLVLDNFGRIGWLVSFCYTVATALRLAKFNTTNALMDKKYFYGLPCPAAAGFIVSCTWGLKDILNINILSWILLLAVSLSTLLMVSNIKYRNFKEFNIKGKVSFFIIILMILLLVVLVWNPPFVLLISFTLYVLSGILSFIKQILITKKS